MPFNLSLDDREAGIVIEECYALDQAGEAFRVSWRWRRVMQLAGLWLQIKGQARAALRTASLEIGSMQAGERPRRKSKATHVRIIGRRLIGVQIVEFGQDRSIALAGRGGAFLPPLPVNGVMFNRSIAGSGGLLAGVFHFMVCLLSYALGNLGCPAIAA